MYDLRCGLTGQAIPTVDPARIRQWFNTAAYSAPPAGSGRLGNSPRDTVVGPGENFWHAALEESIAFSENPRMPKVRLDLLLRYRFQPSQLVEGLQTAMERKWRRERDAKIRVESFEIG